MMRITEALLCVRRYVRLLIFSYYIVDTYRDKLVTSDLQFAFKPEHSTSMCTTVLKEVCSYYNSRGSDVYLCLLDASKAFDRVHYGKLFNLLRARKLPAIVIRLLLDMYTRQRMRSSWNGTTSDHFRLSNGVKQGGILSPILFCVYVDELLNRINSSGLGCHIGHISYAGLGYADDVGTLAPSVKALQSLLYICDDFATEYNVLFNAGKTKCMRIGGVSKPPTRVVKLNGAVIKWNTRAKHLGNILTCDLSDSDDVIYKKGVFISQVNKLLCKMSIVSSNVKAFLFQIYCCSWYGCQTWDLVSGSAAQMNVEWRKAIRRVLRVPFTTRSYLLPLLTRGKSFENQHRSRIEKFVATFLKSDNFHVKYIGERARRHTAGALGRNYSRCLIPQDFQSVAADRLARAQAVRELIDARDGICDNTVYAHDDIVMCIEDLCSEGITRPPRV